MAKFQIFAASFAVSAQALKLTVNGDQQAENSFVQSSQYPRGYTQAPGVVDPIKTVPYQPQVNDWGAPPPPYNPQAGNVWNRGNEALLAPGQASDHRIDMPNNQCTQQVCCCKVTCPTDLCECDCTQGCPKDCTDLSTYPDYCKCLIPTLWFGNVALWLIYGLREYEEGRFIGDIHNSPKPELAFAFIFGMVPIMITFIGGMIMFFMALFSSNNSIIFIDGQAIEGCCKCFCCLIWACCKMLEGLK